MNSLDRMGLGCMACALAGLIAHADPSGLGIANSIAVLAVGVLFFVRAAWKALP
jgi:hypothetical protein